LSNAEGKPEQAREYFEKAIEGLKKVLKLTPNDLEAIRGLSVAHCKLGDLSDAEGKYSTCERKL
jgi:Flp pilus assembly protein TadD